MPVLKCLANPPLKSKVEGFEGPCYMVGVDPYDTSEEPTTGLFRRVRDLWGIFWCWHSTDTASFYGRIEGDSVVEVPEHEGITCQS